MSSEPHLSAHLVSRRTGYSHHGIYVGGGRVIHYAGWADDRPTGPVEEIDLAAFAKDEAYFVITHKDPAPADTIVDRARSRLGEAAYDVAANNCEHFCNWCVKLHHSSSQVEIATAAGTASIATLAGVTGSAAVAASGSVAGLSGPGILSGLAAIGGLVGGGAVAGIATLGAAPGLATATIINHTVLADPKMVDNGEKKVRKLGRAASYAGAVAGSAGTIAAVSVMGTAAGLSGAGISSGLAAVGALVGGGMGAGVLVVATAPVLAAAAAGYTTYKAGQIVLRRSRRREFTSADGSQPPSDSPK
jgi:hypothetical protein